MGDSRVPPHRDGIVFLGKVDGLHIERDVEIRQTRLQSHIGNLSLSMDGRQNLNLFFRIE